MVLSDGRDLFVWTLRHLGCGLKLKVSNLVSRPLNMCLGSDVFEALRGWDLSETLIGLNLSEALQFVLHSRPELCSLALRSEAYDSQLRWQRSYSYRMFGFERECDSFC